MSLLLARLSGRSRALTARLVKQLKGDPSPPQVYCVAQTILKLDRPAQSIAIKPLVRSIMDASLADDSITVKDIEAALERLGTMSLALQITAELQPFLIDVSQFQLFRRAVKITSLVAGPERADVMHNILQQSLDGYFQDNSLEQLALNFFERNQVEKSGPLIVRLMRQRGRGDLLNILSRFDYPSTSTALIELIESCLDPLQHDTILAALTILSRLDARIVDVKRLLAHSRLQEGQFRYFLLEIVSRRNDLKSQFLEALAGSDYARSEFAKDALRKMGATVDEMAARFGKSPVREAVEFFFPEDTIERIWGNKQTLGDNAKRTGINRFGFLVLELLNSLNFLTVYVDRAGKEGVDVIAFSPVENVMILAGVTAGVLKDDIQKINRTTRALRTSTSIASKYHVMSVLFTNLPRETSTPSDRQFAETNSIKILVSLDVDEIVTMARTGRTHSDVIRFIGEKLTTK